MLAIEAEDTIVGQIRVQIALFNDEVVEDHMEELYEEDVDGCTCGMKIVKRATKVGDVVINNITPEGIRYLEAGSVITTGSDLAGDYVMEKDIWEGDEL